MGHDDRDRFRRRSAVVHYSAAEFDDVDGPTIAAEMVRRLRARADLDPDAPPAERDLFGTVAELLESQ